MSIDIDKLRGWIGQTSLDIDLASPAPLRALTATLDRDDPPIGLGQSIPPLWHWLYFLPTNRQAGIGADGHPTRGGFLPPVPLPRRMWAGSRIEFRRPLSAGQTLKRESRIDDVRLKEGRTGPLVFVSVRHEISADGETAILEEQDLVFRDMPPPNEPPPPALPAPAEQHWARRVVPDEVLLFRYSALTFNSHRIHYDRDYATQSEGYAGLVVHGPLIATLLLDLLRHERPEFQVRRFAFKAVRPLLLAPVDLCGHQIDTRSVRLWARTAEGHLAMDATATLD